MVDTVTQDTILSCDWCRDGLEVVGTYSYVDPTGAIVTVRYTAGVNGYEVRAVNLQLPCYDHPHHQINTKLLVCAGDP